MKRIKKIKLRVAALVISFFLTLGLITPAFNYSVYAEALPEVMQGSATIADIVLSYYTTVGAGITNIEWINTLSNSLGESFGTVQDFVNNGYLVLDDSGQWVATQTLTNAIENTSAYTSLGLDQVFNVSAEQVAQGGGAAVASGGAILASTAGTVASTGLVPLFAGVTAAYWAGIGAGTLISNLLQEYVPSIYGGVEITADNTDLVFDNAYPGGSCATITKTTDDDYRYFYLYPAGTLVSGYVASNHVAYLYYYSKSTTNNYKIVQYTGQVNTNGLTKNTFKEQSRMEHTSSYSIPNLKNSYSEVYNFLTAFANSNETDARNYVYSPDVIGESGNSYATYDSEEGKYNVPNFKPMIDPENEAGKPIPVNDYIRFAEDANNNTEQQDYPENGDLFNNLVADNTVNIPEFTPDPEPDPEPDPDPVPNPDPETVPLPDVNPYPDSYPVADPESVPDNKPQPEYTEKATENETDIIEGDPYTTPNLLNKFPFCIPRDILNVFKKLDSGARQAPYIKWRFHPNNMIDYTFEIDFSTWDNVAGLLRLLELLAFIIALGIATRNLILS